MVKTETAFYRQGRRILGLDKKIVEEFKSINQAKNWSRIQQAANGGVGMGYVRVIK